MEKDEGFQEITSCINTLSLWLAAQVAKAIRPHVHAVKQDLEVGDDDDDIGGLFADEYCGEAMAVSDSNGTSPLETLFVLLQDAAAPTITAGFLEDLFIQYNGVAAGENDNDHQLACIFLAYALKRIAQAKQSGGLVSAANLSNHVATLSNLVLAPSVCQALASAMASEVAEMANKNGHEIQGISCLSPLLVTAAYCVPIAGDEQRQPNSSNGGVFRQQLSQIQDFPIATFRAKDNDEVGRVMRDARRTMHTTRSTAVALLRIAFKTGGKEQTFKWLTEIIRSNEQLLHLLKSDLLKSDGIVARSSSRDFLLGLVWSLSDFCQASLLSCLDKKGSKAFDKAFLTEALSETSHEPVNEKNRLFQGSKPSDDGCSTSGESSFDGATHFFFLLSLLLHVGLHPTLRMEYEFEYHYNKFVHAIQERALDDKAPRCSEAVLAKYSPIVATWLGWRTFFDDPELSACLTDVALLQLGWLATVARENCESLYAIPDWLCREPAHWLSRVANKAPHLLKPSQAEKAIEYATLLLDMSTEVRAQSFGFSPIVITSLIQIASSFVQAGVNRARKKQRHRTGMDVDNDRDLDVYSSFDRRDLGVTVFANTIVNEKLCPTLLRTFRAVDAAEGVDADIDSFDKFSAKARIAELLLRLWSHPSGNCRESVASLPPSEICAFVSSVSTAAIVCLDFGTEGIEKMYMNRNEQTVMHAAGNLLGMRNYLALLCALSRDERIAAYLGGCVAESPDCKLVAVNLSNMIVQYLEKLTSVDGGTNQYLEEWDAGEPTSCIVSRLPDLSPPDKESMAKEVVGRRLRMRYDLGLDVSIICHQLFALAAKWHIVAARAGDRDLRDSHFLMALAKNEDVDLIHMENVIKRLVAVPEHIEGSEADNADAIFKHDGYVDHSTWIHEYVDKELEKKQKRIWHLVTQDQMKHSEITGVASNEEIMLFLSDLRRKIESTKASVASSPAAVAEAEEAILSKIGSKCEEDYGKYINSEWIVSSSPFSVNEQGEVFLHNYDNLARKRVMQASAKTLMKEARKIRKTMPLPSANSAIYVCFAEERMDLCRVIVSGPVDTPYAHGLFEFDVYFPPTYPQVPPLVTFMTTGGGRVRFNPNLYVDGKVCISLLGVTTASDESQRWNPELSSLAQLMISIQSQILGVKEPYFNEGNGVPLRMKDTDIGRKGSAKYNNTVRLETLRCAMVNHLNCPPKGFEDISVRHFALCRKRIVVQARRWMLEARGTSLYGRYERAYGELVVLLGAQNTKFECLEPLAEDINALESLEPAFIRIIADRIETIPEDGADEVLGAQDSTVLNPWAASPEQVRAWVKSTKEKGNDSDSSSCDELYE
jgi:ubiquitin-protein ligase